MVKIHVIRDIAAYHCKKLLHHHIIASGFRNLDRLITVFPGFGLFPHSLMNDHRRFYLKKIRMQKAKELLMADSGSISDIARLTGFTSISTFSKVFKAENGFSPTEYGKQIYKRRQKSL